MADKTPPYEGYVQVPGPLIPTGDNERAWVTEAEYIAGADRVHLTLAEFLAIHPQVLKKRGVRARIVDHPQLKSVTEYVLVADPADLIDGNGDSIVTADNFLEYWDQIASIETTLGYERVYEYAPDGSGGGAPPFPYTNDPGFEANWTPIFDATLNHEWIRFRDDDVDTNADDIFDNWTAPIPINQSYEDKDYVDSLFKRQALINDIPHLSTATMTDGLWYIVALIKIINTTQSETYFKGKIFQYDSADTLAFEPSAVVNEYIEVIPRTKTSTGLPNNDADPPGGWQGTPPGGTDQLWKATGQKSVYGQLKSSWIVTRIADGDANYVRYSATASNHPNTICDVDDEAATGVGKDSELITAGWHETFVATDFFMATRSNDQHPSSPKYTTWLVQKISEESGEYPDRVFKLYPVGLDADSILVITPTSRDAIKEEGWSDIPLEETINEINYFSECRKFFDGTLKTPWSRPMPYTGQDTYLDTIVSNLGDDFKTDQDGATVPSEIVLTAQLWRGVLPIWEQADATITYVWKKIYDGGAVVDVSPTEDTGEFHTKDASAGAPGEGEFLNDQRVGIEPTAVTGKAVFECTQTYNPGGGAPVIIFVDTFDILDITDGIDVRSIALGSETNIIIWDESKPSFVPATIVLSAFQSNLLTGDTFYWYKHNGVSWIEYTTSDAHHTFPDGINGKSLILTTIAGTLNNVTDLVFTVPGSGADAQITSAGSNMPAMSVSDEFEIREHSDPENNGVYVVITVNTSTSDYEVDKIGTGGTTPVTAASEAAEIYTVLTSPMTLNQFSEVLRYAVTNTQADPDTADYSTKFSDYNTITKLGSTSVSEDGTNAVQITMSNEAHAIALNTTTGNPLANQIGATGTAISIATLFDGVVPQVYNTDYSTVSVATISVDTGLLTDVTFGWADNLDGNIKMYVDTWVGANGPRNAVGRISITYGLVTYIKDFTINSTLDGIGAQILDIDSNTGFTFTPQAGGRDDKTLTAKFYDQNVLDVTEDYRYRWYVDDVLKQALTTYGSGGHTYVLTSALVQGGSFVKCDILTNPGDVLVRTRTVYIQDMTDAKRFLLYWNYSTLQTTPPATPSTPANSTIAGFTTDFPASGNGEWVRAPGTTASGTGSYMYFVSDGIELDDKSLVFSTAWRVRNEQAAAGQEGGFIRHCYNGNSNDDDNRPSISPTQAPGSSNLGCTTGWSFILPTCDTVWASDCLYDSTNARVGTWGTAYRISGADGAPGSSGGPGATGPGYNSITDLGIVNLNRRIRFEGVNGASDKTIDIPDGPTGPIGPSGVTDGIDHVRWTQKYLSTPSGSIVYTDWVYLDWIASGQQSNQVGIEIWAQTNITGLPNRPTWKGMMVWNNVQRYVRMGFRAVTGGGMNWVECVIHKNNTTSGSGTPLWITYLGPFPTAVGNSAAGYFGIRITQH